MALDWRKLLSGVGGMFDYSPSSEYVKQVQASDDEIEQAEWQKIIQSWAYDMAPASGDIGQYRKPPALLPPVADLTGKAPVDEDALYGNPSRGVASIVNLRRKRRR